MTFTLTESRRVEDIRASVGLNTPEACVHRRLLKSFFAKTLL